MTDKSSLLVPGAFYHVYNRANGSEKLFLSNENYRYFIRRYKFFIFPIAKTYCYCLMPNHFHFLVEIRGEEELRKTFPKFKTLEMFPQLLSKQFSNFFSSYTQSFNKQQNRMGSLFMKNFNRIRIEDDNYLLNLVQYIHQNPVEARFCFRAMDWEYSSYKEIVANDSSFVESQKVIEWHGDLANFALCHSRQFETRSNELEQYIL